MPDCGKVLAILDFLCGVFLLLVGCFFVFAWFDFTDFIYFLVIAAYYIFFGFSIAKWAFKGWEFVDKWFPFMGENLGKAITFAYFGLFVTFMKAGTNDFINLIFFLGGICLDAAWITYLICHFVPACKANKAAKVMG